MESECLQTFSIFATQQNPRHVVNIMLMLLPSQEVSDLWESVLSGPSVYLKEQERVIFLWDA